MFSLLLEKITVFIGKTLTTPPLRLDALLWRDKMTLDKISSCKAEDYVWNLPHVEKIDLKEHLKNVTEQATRMWDKYHSAKREGHEQLTQAIYDILLETPLMGYKLLVSFHPELGEMVAQKVLSCPRLDEILESEPSAVYLAGQILEDEHFKERARKSLVGNSISLAYYFSKEYKDKTLLDYARDAIARQVFPSW